MAEDCWGVPTGRTTRELLAGIEMRDHFVIKINALPGTRLAEAILNYYLPDAMEHFLRRNAEYGDDNDFNLGAKGQYVDISRKVQKLKKRMWDENPIRPGEESTETVIKELIGHLLMALAYYGATEGDENAQ